MIETLKVKRQGKHKTFYIEEDQDGLEPGHCGFVWRVTWFVDGAKAYMNMNAMDTRIAVVAVLRSLGFIEIEKGE